MSNLHRFRRTRILRAHNAGPTGSRVNVPHEGGRVRRRVLVGALVATVATLVVATAGYGKPTAPAAQQVLPSASCGPVVFNAGSSPQFIIASDLPLQGAGRAQTVEMTKAISFVLQRHGFKAGKYTVGYQSCDDSTAQAGKWVSAKCAANAAAYAADQTVIGVIGTFNSGCAQIVIPVLNRAPNGPVAMISPANTYVGLTQSGPGTAAGEPAKYYPTGKRNYARIVAADNFQGAADAMLAKQLGVKRLYILNDKESYGLGVATNTRNAARKLGIQVVGFEAWDPKASSYEALATKIKASGAQGVFLGGLICENGGKLVKDLRTGLGAAVRIMAPDGFTPISAVVQGAGAQAEGVTVSVAGLPNEQLKGAGKTFLRQFSARLGGKQADPYSVYAAQAAEIMVAAIAKSDGTRASVAEQLLKTNVRNGILGSFKLTSTGDTTNNPVTVYQIKGGKSTTFKVIVPPTSLVKVAG
jgi:branched-chain amino acid transport system substrate-binding protein